MRVANGRDGDGPSQRLTETFSGEVMGDSILPRADGAMVLTVVFSPGARTHWHTHDGGQVLFVTHGRGLVCKRDGDARWVTAGDVVHFAPGEEHWHGAGPDTYLVHTAVSIGGTTWDEPVDDSSFEAAYG